MDRASLRSVENQPGIPASIKTLPDGAAGLLAEFQSAEESGAPNLKKARDAVGGLNCSKPRHSPTCRGAGAALEDSRRNVSFGRLGAQERHDGDHRRRGIPRRTSGRCGARSQPAVRKHDYHNAIIFGHAKDGNLHFVITQSFNDQAAIDQYARFIDEVVEVVVDRYDGALKAEHGTGRNMAPFVETEWGSEAYDIMRRLKELVDPDNLLNPGVIINPDRSAHLADLKRIPTVEAEVDKCIECGYCEPKCPSRELTLTPRQRIVVRREMAR